MDQLNTPINALLVDMKRFIRSCISTIHSTPLQLYSSAILFSPRSSLVRNEFWHEIPDWIHIPPDVDSTWSLLLQTLDVPKGDIDLLLRSQMQMLLDPGEG